MLSTEDNELLTRVGPGTPMGNLMRQYWLPALLSSEVLADGEPVRVMLLGEQLIDKHQYAASIPILEGVAKIAPKCEKCLLLLAKSEMLTGNPATAYKVLQSHKNGSFEKSRLTDEVDTIAKRISGAHEKYQQALEFDAHDQRALTEMALIYEDLNRPERAIALYERLGFVRSGLRKAYYDRGAAGFTDALVMRLDLAAAAPYPP